MDQKRLRMNRWGGQTRRLQNVAMILLEGNRSPLVLVRKGVDFPTYVGGFDNIDGANLSVE